MALALCFLALAAVFACFVGVLCVCISSALDELGEGE